MKKFWLLFILALTISGAASAQKVLSFGPKVGINISSLSGLKDITRGVKPDFTGGLFLEFRPFRFIGFSVEALYSAQNVDSEMTWGGSTNHIKANLGYIATPIMAKIYLGKRFSINAGYQPAFALTSSIRLGRGGEFVPIKTRPVISSIPVGVSYGFSWGLLLDIRYNIAVSNIANFPYDPQTPGQDGLNSQVVTISAGWRF